MSGKSGRSALGSGAEAPGRRPSNTPSLSTEMTDGRIPELKSSSPRRKFFTGTRLIREVTYVHQDEAEALAARAEHERCSKAEILRRALRAYLGL